METRVTNEHDQQQRRRRHPAAETAAATSGDPRRRRTKTTFWLGADERAALAAIRARYGVATDADALRIALRLATAGTAGETIIGQAQRMLAREEGKGTA